MTIEMKSFQAFQGDALAVVIGASGGVGSAIAEALQAGSWFDRTIGFSRASEPGIDLCDEESIIACCRYVAQLGVPRLIVDATGLLHGEHIRPEKSWRELDPKQMTQAFAINAIGPALLMKHFLPLLPREGKAVFATLSAKVGSIGDNQLGGWYSYRASKAALNQLVRTAAIELHRRQPNAICIALHPGTVDTRLSSPFRKTGLELQSPTLAATRLLTVIDNLSAADTGSFFDQHGKTLPW
jgi:NAD(P)-dependent dehydrogenase (short-subunit alcohol dehydrogenase family)